MENAKNITVGSEVKMNQGLPFAGRIGIVYLIEKNLIYVKWHTNPDGSKMAYGRNGSFYATSLTAI